MAATAAPAHTPPPRAPPAPRVSVSASRDVRAARAPPPSQSPLLPVPARAHRVAPPLRRHSAPDLPAHRASPSPPRPEPAPSKRRRDLHPSSLLHTPALPVPPTDDRDDDFLVSSVFTWNFGGQLVYIAGAWDSWAAKTPMYKNGSEHIALIYVPCGVYQFKYLVDDVWQCASNLPTRTDDTGNTNNVVTIAADELEFDSPTPLHDDLTPRSPISSYIQNTTKDFAKDFSLDPPVLPPHLEIRALKPLPEDIIPIVALPVAATPRGSAPHDGSPPAPPLPAYRPFNSHVYIDHLYQAKKSPENANDDVLSLLQTTRIGGKVINTIFVTTRSSPHHAYPEPNGVHLR